MQRGNTGRARHEDGAREERWYAANATLSASTGWGLMASQVVPRPSCPFWLRPKEKSSPEAVIASVCVSPQAIRSTRLPASASMACGMNTSLQSPWPSRPKSPLRPHARGQTQPLCCNGCVSVCTCAALSSCPAGCGLSAAAAQPLSSAMHGSWLGCCRARKSQADHGKCRACAPAPAEDLVAGGRERHAVLCPTVY